MQLWQLALSVGLATKLAFEWAAASPSECAAGMVGFGNPRYEGGGGGGGGGGSKWLPPSLSNKLDNLNVLPKAPKTTAAGRGMRNDDVSITSCVAAWLEAACTAEDLLCGCLGRYHAASSIKQG